MTFKYYIVLNDPGKPEAAYGEYEEYEKYEEYKPYFSPNEDQIRSAVKRVDPIKSWSPRLRLLVAALFLIFIALFGFVLLARTII